MARLNEIPQPPVQAVVESVDVLKRRFIRQNREITRVNSTQSLRIRNLETEISRLLAENIALREQAIAAALEAEKWRKSQSTTSHLKAVKERLDRKLAEVNGLVQELGLLADKDTKTSRRSSDGGSRWSVLARRYDDSMRSPNERDWRNRQPTNSIPADGQSAEGRLPAILEDKYYPRRTLEPAEIQLLPISTDRLDFSQSPDLGPPPVAHFEVSDPIKFDMQKTQIDNPPNEDLVPLPSNLETRRKRRTSSLLSELADSDMEQSIPPLSQSSLSGAKRKLDITEIEQPVVQKTTENEDFVFQRRPLASRGSRFSRPQSEQHASNAKVIEVSSPPKPAASARRILAPKSVNSPTKRRFESGGKLETLEKDQHQDVEVIQIDSPKSRSRLPPTIPSPFEEMATDTQENEDCEFNVRAPKTPALFDDILSPPSTEPPTKTDSRSIEAAISSSVEDVLNGSIGRGSRRARAAVSYAEPNLRDKMRRPGKALVGAVEGIDRTRESIHCRTSISEVVDRAKNEEVITSPERLRIVKIRPDRSRGDDEKKWNTLPMHNAKNEDPASPLGGKDTKHSNVNKVGANTEDEVVEQLNTTRNSRGSSIFDLPGSSPLRLNPTDDSRNNTTTKTENRPSSSGSTSSTNGRRPSTSTNSISTHSRRHSVQHSHSSSFDTIPAPKPNLNTSKHTRLSSATNIQNDQSTLPNPHTTTTTTRRTIISTNIGTGQENDDSTITALKKANHLNHTSSRSISGLAVKSKHEIDHDNTAKGTEGGISTATLRSLSRRRSMMV